MPESEPLVLKARFKDSFHDVYFGREAVMLESIDELPGKQAGVRVAFCSNRQDVAHFLLSVDGGDFRHSPDVSAAVTFEDSDQQQESTVAVKAVFADGSTSEARTISLRYYSRKFYAAQKMADHPNILMVVSDPVVDFCPGRVEDWRLEEPSQETVEYAAGRWGDAIAGSGGDYEKAKALAKALMHELWPHAGFPSDAMKGLAPFQQYERMVSGADRGYCSNFADIYVCACNGLGILARRVHMQYVHGDSEKFRTQMGSMHSSSEIFDGQTNQWVWIDLRYYALGAYLGTEGPLNLAELHLFLQQPQRRKRLRLHIYDLQTQTEKLLPLAACPKQQWDCFDGADNQFHYSKRASP